GQSIATGARLAPRQSIDHHRRSDVRRVVERIEDQADERVRDRDRRDRPWRLNDVDVDPEDRIEVLARDAHAGFTCARQPLSPNSSHSFASTWAPSERY